LSWRRRVVAKQLTRQPAGAKGQRYRQLWFGVSPWSIACRSAV
jgi:hypothetical protein